MFAQSSNFMTDFRAVDKTQVRDDFLDPKVDLRGEGDSAILYYFWVHTVLWLFILEYFSFLLFTNIFVCSEFSLFVCFLPPGTSLTLTLCHKGLTLFISHHRNWDQPCFQNRDQPYYFSNVFISSVQNEYHPYLQNQDQPYLLSNLSLPKVNIIININPLFNMVLSQIFSHLFHEWGPYEIQNYNDFAP